MWRLHGNEIGDPIHRGITGITQNASALDRFFLIAPELIKDFHDSYCTDSDQPATKEHYQLSGSMAVRMFNNSRLIKKGIVKHCEGNPFSRNSNEHGF